MYFKAWIWSIALGALCWLPGSVQAQSRAQVRRFALVVGANNGGPDRVRLHHAVSDAETFGSVLEQLGGVASSDLVTVEEPDVAALDKALAEFARRVAEAHGSAVRVQTVIYYSGHSDHKGLLLRGEHYSYRKLRRRLEKIGADVRLVILDSCGAGAMTRTKGGKRRPPFLSDAASRVQGLAILASSSANEPAQESDKLGASFFTHFLVSGLCGAADVNDDERVTLNEAYQFAFAETLARTEKTRGGAQHAAYDMELSGRGDLVLTDVRQTSTTLVLAKELHGRIYVRGADGRLAVELEKRAGSARTLGLPAGRYQITRAADGYSKAQVDLKPGKQKTLSADDFEAIDAEEARARGAAGGPTAASSRWSAGEPVSLADQFHLAAGMAEFRLGAGLTRSVVTGDGPAVELLFRWAISDRLNFVFPLMFSGQVWRSDHVQWALTGGLSGIGYSSVGGVDTSAVVATSVQVRPVDGLALVARGGMSGLHSWGAQTSTWGAGASLNATWALGSRLSGGLGVGYAYAQMGSAVAGALSNLSTRTLQPQDSLIVGAIGGRSVGNMPLLQVRLWHGLHLYESSTVSLAPDTLDVIEHSHILGLSWYYETDDD